MSSLVLELLFLLASPVSCVKRPSPSLQTLPLTTTLRCRCSLVRRSCVAGRHWTSCTKDGLGAGGLSFDRSFRGISISLSSFLCFIAVIHLDLGARGDWGRGGMRGHVVWGIRMYSKGVQGCHLL